MTYQQSITHFLGQSIGFPQKDSKLHLKKQKLHPTLLEESSKTLPKTPSLGLNYSLEDCIDAYKEDPCDNWDDYAGG